jgi:hemolysin activation/secretion protein
MLSGDRGYYWRNDLAWAIGHSAHSVYAGVDYGQVFGPTTSLLAGTRLAGAVIGLRGMAGKHAGGRRAVVAATPAIVSGSGASMAPGPRVPTPPSVATASAPASSDEGTLSVPGVLSYDLFAGTPLLTPHGFTMPQLTVGFQLSYQYWVRSPRLIDFDHAD